MDTRSTLARVAAILAVTLAAILTCMAYASTQRKQADALLGFQTVQALARVGTDVSAGEAEYQHTLDFGSLDTHLFLRSDSALRLPEVAEHVERASLAYGVVGELRIAKRHGELEPDIDDIDRGEEAARTFSSVAANVSGDGEGARLVDSGGHATEALLNEGAREVRLATQALSQLDVMLPSSEWADYGEQQR